SGSVSTLSEKRIFDSTLDPGSNESENYESDESDIEEINIEQDNEEIETLPQNEKITQKKLFEILKEYQQKEKTQEKTLISVRLEAPRAYEAEYYNLKYTFAFDMIIYMMTRLFRMHIDLLDIG
ncbi:hypothetical protein G9A89_004358, partial [Geosiphon pyriformis]